MSPRVSVVIPTHNRTELLREALDSVAAQTFRDYEVIVVDDGSEPAIEACIEAHPTRPRTFRLPARRGPAAARNRGIREARGELVAFLDSDDLWHPRKLECFVQALDAHPNMQLFYGPMAPIDSHGAGVPGRTKPCHGGRITEPLFCSSFVHVPTVVCRRELLVGAGGFDESLPVCEDYDLWLRLSIDEPFGLIDEPLAKRRLHGDRLSKSCMSRNLAVKARVLCKFYESIAGRDLVDPQIAADRLARTCFVAGRAAFRDGQYRQADALCQASRHYGGSIVRTMPLRAASRAMALFERNGSSAAPGAPAPIGAPVRPHESNR